MNAFVATSVNHMYPSVVGMVYHQGQDIFPVSGNTPVMGQVHNHNKEIRKVSMDLLDGRRRVNSIRPINLAFALAEVLWILQGRDDVEMVAHYNKQMKEYSDNGTTLHGAYGKRIYHRNQLEDAYRTLRDSPASRQAVLHIGIPELDLGAVTKDKPCNQYAEMIIRNGKLHWNQHMRSNDIVWGTPYNFIQWGFLHEVMAGWLDVEVGEYCHIISSAHIYERHYDQAERISNDYSTNRDIHSYYEPNDYRIDKPHWASTLSSLQFVEEMSRIIAPGKDVSKLATFQNLSPAWQNFMLVIGAYNSYTLEKYDIALNQLHQITNEFKPLLARQFTKIERSLRYDGIPVDVLENVIDPLEALSRKGG